jgi:flagellar motor switch protein FliN/FliY
MISEMEQENLAEDWEAALQESGDIPAEGGGDAEASAEAAGEAIGGDLDAALGGDGEGEASSDDALAEEWAAALVSEEEDQMRDDKATQGLAAQSVDAAFKDLTKEAKAPRPDGVKRDLDFILDIPLDVSAELGRTKLLINELLQLGQGSVIELNKLAGEPLEIYVNGKLVARGEAVVINEKFGVRLTDIISPIERVKQLA